MCLKWKLESSSFACSSLVSSHLFSSAFLSLWEPGRRFFVRWAASATSFAASSKSCPLSILMSTSLFFPVTWILIYRRLEESVASSEEIASDSSSDAVFAASSTFFVVSSSFLSSSKSSSLGPHSLQFDWIFTYLCSRAALAATPAHTAALLSASLVTFFIKSAIANSFLSQNFCQWY